MVKRGHFEEMMLGDGLWLVGPGDERFVTGVLATAVLRPGGACLLDWEGFFVLLCS